MTVTSSTPFLNSAEQGQIRDLLRRTAKTEIMPRFQNLSAQDVSTKSRDDDLVTKADLASEAMITAELQNLFPHAVVVGGVLANVLANLAFAMRALNAPAAQILRARE